MNSHVPITSFKSYQLIASLASSLPQPALLSLIILDIFLTNLKHYIILSINFTVTILKR